MAGTGTLNLTGSSPNTLTLNGATLILGSASSLGGTLDLISGTLVASVPLTLPNAVQFSGSGTVTFGFQNPITLSGSVTVTGTSTVVVNDTLTITGVISGTGGFVQQGSGTMVLAPTTNNTFGGGYTLNTSASPGASAALSGVLVLGTTDQPLGTGIVTLTSGALQASTNITLPNGVVLNGLATIQGTNNVTFSGASTLGSASSALTVNNPVTTVSGIITGVAGNNLVVAGTGQLVFTADNTYAGNTIINGGTLTLNGNGAITPASAASITVNSGGALTLDNTATAVSGRLNSQISLNLKGGTFTLTGNSAGVVELIGQVNLIGGQSVFTTNPNGGTLSFTSTALVRSVGATVSFNGAGLGGASNQILFTTPPIPAAQQATGIQPYAIVNNNDFATYNDGSNTGIGAPTAANFYYTGPLASAPTNANVKLTASDAVASAGQTINSLLIVGSNLTVGGTGALTLASGGLAVSGSGDTISAPISQGATETIVTTSNGLNLTGGLSAGTATAAGALTLSGGGTVVVNNTNFKNTVGFTTSLNNVTAAFGSVSGATISTLGTLNLVAGTLALSPQASTATNGLASLFVTLPDQNNTGSLYDFNNLPLASGSPPSSTPNVNFNTGGNISFYSGGPIAQFGVQWTGMINITQAGPTTFTLSSDDSTRLWIDGVLVIDNDGGHGVQTISNTIDLSAGLHDIKIDYTQGGGGDEAILSYTPFGGVSQVVPTNVLYTPDALLTALPNAVNVTGASSIQILGSAFSTIGFGALIANAGSTLSVTGLAGKTLTFTSTTLTGSGAFNLNDAPNVTLGTVTGAAIINIGKLGTGQLVLNGNGVGNAANVGNIYGDNTGANSLAAGSNLDIYAGKVVAIGNTSPSATDPLSNLAVTLDGGTLSLDSSGGIPGGGAGSSPTNALIFNNPVTVVTSGTIEAQAGNVNFTLGSGTTGINILTGQTLTLNAYAGNAQISGANVTIPGVISGNGNLNVIGTWTGTDFTNLGSVTLNGANNFTGQTTISGSDVYLGNAGALGTSTSPITIGDPNGLVASGLLANVAFSTSSNIVVQATVPGTVTIGSNAGVPVTFSGNVTSNVTVVLNAAAGSTVTFSGNLDLGLGGETVQGGGTVVESGADTYSGTTSITAGTLLASSTTASPTTSTVAITGGIFSLSGNTTIGGLTGTAGIVALGSNTLTVGGLNGTSTFGGTISADGGLIKTGTGTLNLTGTANFTGAIQVNGGILNVNATFTSISGVTVASGASLELNPTTAGANYTMPLILNGTGFDGIGALVNVTAAAANSPTWSGNITLNSGAGNPVAIGSLTTTNKLLLTGVVSGASDLVIVGTGRIDLQNADSYGNTIIDGGTLALSGAVGTVSTASFTVNPLGTLLLDDTTTTLTGRAGIAGITLNGGALTLTGNGGANSDSVGAVTLNDGNSTITATTAADSLTLTSLSRTSGSGATVNFPGSGTVAITNVAGVPLVGGILPYATVGSGASLAMATYTGSNPSFVGAVTGTVSTLTAGANVVLTANTAVTAPVAINSLNLNGFSLTGSSTLTVSSGLVVNSATTGTATITAPLAFSTAEAILVTNSGASTTILGSLSGSGGLTVSGGGTLTLNTTNNLTGATTLDGGTLVLATPSAISSGTLSLVAGTLQNAVSMALSNAVALNNSAVTFTGTAPLTFTRNVTLTNSADNTNTLTTTNTGGVVFTGSLSGTGSLTILGTGALSLTPSTSSSYSGGTNLNTTGTTATLIVNNNTALGTGVVSLGGGSIAPTVATTLTNSIQFGTFTGAAVTFAVVGSNNLTLSGSTVLLANTTLNLINSIGTTTLSGVVSGPGSLTINGTTITGTAAQPLNFGNLVLSGANTFAAGLTLNGGTLTVGSSSTVSNGVLVNGPAGLGTLTLNGGTIQATGASQSLANSVTLNATVGGVTFAGNNLTFTGLATLTANSNLVVSNTTTFANTITSSNFTNTVTYGNVPFPAYFGLTESGTGNLVLAAVNDYNGNTVVSGGTLTLSGAGALVSSGNVIVNQGGTLTLDNTGTNSTTRLSNASGLIFNGGTVNFLGSASASSTQVLGGIVLNAGTSTINVTPGTGQTALLTAGVLDRTPGATLTLPSTIGSASSQLVFTTAPTLTNGILPYVIVGGTDVGTYGANGVAVNTSYSSTLTAGATSNVKFRGNAMLTGNTTVNSLILTAGATLDLAGFTLTITSGLLFNASSSAVTVSSSTGNGTLAFGSTDGIITTTAGGGNIITSSNVTLTGTSGLTFSGGGVATVNGSSTVTGVNSVQTIVLNGQQTGGTFTLSFSCLTTGAITLSATAATTAANIQAALGALANIGASNVLVSAINANAYAVTFENVLAGQPVLPLLVNTQNLTPAGPVTGTVNATTVGVYALNLDGGTLVVGNSSLVSGGLSLTSGTLQTSVSGGLSVPYATTLNNATVTFAGSNSLLFTGPVFLGGQAANVSAGNGNPPANILGQFTNNTVSVNNTAPTVFDGVMSGPGTLFIGSGTGALILSGANTYTGTTIVTPGGVVQAQGAASFGTGLVSVLSGGAVRLLDAGITYGNAFVLNGSGVNGSGAVENMTNAANTNTLSGSVTLVGNATVGVDANSLLTLSGGVGGGGGLIKAGAGTLNLTSANTYAGATTINVGQVNLTNGTALGSLLGVVTVSSGATLQLQNTITVAGKQLTLSGSGFGNNGSQPQGALSINNTNDSWTGNIVLPADSSLGSTTAGDTLTISGSISGSASLTKVGPGAVTLSAPNTYTNNTNVYGGTLNLTNANAYAGTTSINGASYAAAFVDGTLNFTGLGALTAASPDLISVNQGSTLQLDDNTSNNVVNRLNGAAITFNGGTLTLLANNNAGSVTSETVGTITLASGQSTIDAGFTAAAAAGATSTLTSSSLARSNGATVNFIGGTANVTPLGTADNMLLFSNLSANPTTTTALQYVGNQGNILPYGEVNGGPNTGDFATYTTNGIAAFSNYAVQNVSGNTTLTNVAGDIVKIIATAAATITGPANAIGALLINNTSGAAVSFNPNFSSAGTITSGAILTLGSGAATDTLGGGSNPTLDLGTETIVFQNNSGTGNTTFTGGYLAGSGGLTIAGANTLTLGNNTNAVQTITFTAVTTIAGTFTLTWNGQTTAPITYSSTAATLQGNIEQALYALPNIGPLGQNSVAVSASATAPTVTFQNALGATFIPLLGVNAGGLNGTGTIAVTNTTSGGQANTYTGPTALNAGTALIQNSTSFGTGAVTLTGGTLTTNVALSLGNAVTFNGPVTFTNSGSLTLLGPVTLAANNALTINTNPLLITGAISGAAAVPLTLAAGNNTLELFGSSTATGGTVVNGGTLQVANPAALGSGPVVLVGGSLNSFSDITINNPVYLPNTTGIISGSNNITLTNLDVLGSGDLQVTNGGLTTIAGSVGAIPGSAGGVLTRGGSSGTSVILLNPTTNTTTGTYVSAGILLLASASALGSGPLVLNGGNVAANTALTVSNNVLVGGGTTFIGTNPLTLGGPVTLLGSQTLTVNNATTIAGTILEGDGSSSLTVAGIGTLTLGTLPKAYSGGTILNATTVVAPVATLGTLLLSGPTSLGTGTLTLTNGTLETGSVFNIPNAVNLNGGQVSFSGSNPITFSNTFQASNSLTAGSTTTLNVNTPTTFNEIFTGTTGNLALQGTSTLNLTQPFAYTGSTMLNGGTLDLSGAGVLTGTSAVTVNQGGTLTLDDTGTNLANRVNTAANVTLNGGTFNFLGNSTQASSQAFSTTLTLTGGNSTISTASGTAGGTATLTFSKLTRNAGSTLVFAGINSPVGAASNQVIFTSQVTLTGSTGNRILPYALVTDSSGVDVATQSAAGVSISHFANYSTSANINNAATGSVYELTSATTNSTISVGTNLSLNAVLINGTGLTLGGGAGSSLTLTGGGLLVSGGSNTVGVPTLALGTTEGVLLTNAGSTANVSSVITGTGGLTIGGAGGTVTLSGADTWTGTTALNSGTLVVANNTALSTGPLTLTSGTIQTTLANGLVLTNPVTLNNAQITLAGSNNLIFAGALTINGVNTITVTNTGITDFNGTYNTSSGTLYKAGAGTLTLSGGSTNFTGQIFVDQGILLLENTNALGATGGSSTVVANGASIQLLGTGLVFNKPLVISGAGVTGNGALENLIGSGGVVALTAATGANTWSGAITLSGNTTIGADAGTALLDTGVITGGFGLTKVGVGSLVLNAANTYTGQTNINNGVVNVQNATGLGLVTGSVVVNTGAVGAVQYLNFTGSPTGGTFTLSFNGTNTSPITYSSTFSVLKANILAALTALPGIGSGNVGISGAISSVVVTFLGSLAASSQLSLAVVTNALTGGTSPNVSVVSYGATLQQQVGTIAGKQLTLNGLGFGNVGAYSQGALYSNGSNTWTGDIVLNPGTAIGGTTGSNFTLSGIVSGTDLTKNGNGTFGLTLLGANTYTGNTTVNGGTLTLSNTNAYEGATNINMAASNRTVNGGALLLNLLGAALQTSSITINGSGVFSLGITALQLDSTQLESTNRLSTATPITLNGGMLNFVAANTVNTATSQALGAVTLASGQSTIAAGFDLTTSAQVAPGATAQLTFTNLIRNSGATVNFLGGSAGLLAAASTFGFTANNISPLGTATNQILINQINGAAPSAAIVGSSTVAGHIGDGILPWAEVNGAAGTGGFATYNGSAGIGINAFQGYAMSIAAASPTDTVLETSPETVTAGKTINALFVYATAALQVTLNAGVSLTLTSGAFSTAGTLGQIQIGNAFAAGAPQGTLNFGAAEGIIFANNSSNNLNVDTFISGTGGVTVGRWRDRERHHLEHWQQYLHGWDHDQRRHVRRRRLQSGHEPPTTAFSARGR